MKKKLCTGLTAIFLNLTAGVAVADTATSPLSDRIASETMLLTLADSDMDSIVAAAQTTAASARASALRGNVAAFSITQLVASQMVGVSVASSLAIAIGIRPQTTAFSSAPNF